MPAWAGRLLTVSRNAQDLEIAVGAANFVKEVIENAGDFAQCGVSSLADAVATSNPFGGAPDFIACLDSHCGSSTPCDLDDDTQDYICPDNPGLLATAMGDFCGSLIESDLAASARRAIALMRKFEKACPAAHIPGVFEWTKAVSISASVEVELGAYTQVASTTATKCLLRFLACSVYSCLAAISSCRFDAA